MALFSLDYADMARVHTSDIACLSEKTDVKYANQFEDGGGDIVITTSTPIKSYQMQSGAVD